MEAEEESVDASDYEPSEPIEIEPDDFVMVEYVRGYFLLRRWRMTNYPN